MKRTVISRWGFGLLLPMAAAVALAHCGSDRTGDKKNDITPVDAGPGISQTEETQLQQVARAMQTFHVNTGGWPYGNGVWYVSAPNTLPEGGSVPSSSGSFWAGTFTINDTALFSPTMQPPLSGCDAGAGGLDDPCWEGPYLTPASPTASLGATQWYDVWHHPLLYMYLPPAGTPGGSSANAADGKIFLWSMGPDGKDGFACTDGSCALNLNVVAQGKPSQSGADDLIITVADSAI